MNRRTALTSVAWSIPVITLAVAAPAASASTTQPPEAFACVRVPGKGQPQWAGTFTDGTSINMSNGEAMSGIFGELCRAAGTNPGAGK